MCLPVVCICKNGFRSHPDPSPRIPREPIDILIGIGVNITGFPVLTFAVENDLVCRIKSFIVFATDIDRYLFPFVCQR